jgi:hypothetical protein
MDQKDFSSALAEMQHKSMQVREALRPIFPNNRVLVLIAPERGEVTGKVLCVNNCEPDEIVAILQDMLDRYKGFKEQLETTFLPKIN